MRLGPIILLAAMLAACRPSDDAAIADSAAEQSRASAPLTDSAPTCHLTMGWDPWEPYHFAAAGGRAQGLDIDLVSALGERVDCEFEFIQGSWASLLRLLQAGELDVLSGASITPEREEYARFSDTYREERFALFVRTEEHARWKDQSLAKLLAGEFRVGVTQGYLYPEPIQALQSDPELENRFFEVPIGELNLNALLDYRIDGFLEDPYVVASIQRRRSSSGEIEALDLDFGMNDVHLLFSRESVSADLVDRFDRALDDMIADGSHAELMARYLN